MSRYMLLSVLLALSSTMSLAQKDTTWLRRWAGPGLTDQEDWARDIAVDDLGNVYVTGVYDAGGTGGGYVTLKYSSTGRLRWERLYYGMTYNEAHALAVDSAHNVWVTGESGGTSRDIFTIGYDSDGNVVWNRRSDFAGGTDAGYAIDAFGRDHVAITGYASKGGAPVIFHGAIDWSRQVPGMWGQAIDVTSSSITVAGIDSGGFGAVRYDFAGNLLWHRASGKAVGGYSIAVPSIVVDSAGNSYVAGTTGDAYTVSFSNNGAVRWSALYSGPRRDAWVGLALDSKLNVVTGGYTDVGTGSSYAYRCVVAKYDFEGNPLWSKVLDFGGVKEGLDAIAVGKDDAIYVAGERAPSQSGDADYLIAKLSPSGDVVWWTTYAGNGTSYSTASAIAVDTSGGLYVTGWSSQNNEWPDNADIVTIKFWGRKQFRPNPDGWQFNNSEETMWPQTWWSRFDYTKPPFPSLLTSPPINATSADFPDWPLFVDVFGVDQCYKKAGDGNYYFSPKALLQWRCMVEEEKERDATTGEVTTYWSGACPGFCVSALQFFNQELSLQWALGDYKSVYSVPINDDSRYLVNRAYITFSAHFRPTMALTGSQAFNALKRMLVDSYTNDRLVSLQDLVTDDAHAVVACSLASVGSGFWELSVYDPNHPGTYMHLNYHEVEESWTAEDMVWNGLELRLLPIEDYVRTPTLPIAGNVTTALGAAPDSLRTVFNTPWVDIWIHDAEGKTIGCAGGALIDSMPGAFPRLCPGVKAIPPGGYFLPPGEYTARIGGSRDSTAYFAVFLDDAAFSFHRQEAKAFDNEILRFSTEGRSLSITNPDPVPKPLFLQSIESLSGEETVCRLHVRAMPPGDSLGVQLTGSRDVSLVVGSGAIAADLRLELAKDFANPVFEYAGLVLKGGACYRVAPVWDSLAAIPLRIYVDRDRDGTMDDTLFLTNQSTIVPQDRGMLTADHFELYQNYPNPFNPSTTLKYELPKPTMVRLSVYDVLGREVSVVVDQRKEAGIHEVTFDASHLSSGVYLYRLFAGDFVQTRKLVVVR